MSINLSIKGVPEDVAERLRQRAERNHRSLQGELMAIVEQAAAESAPFLAQAEPRRAAGNLRRGSKTIDQIAAELHALRPQPRTDLPLAVDIIRRDRDSR